MARSPKALVHGIGNARNVADLPTELLKDRRKDDQPGPNLHLATRGKESAIS